MTGEPFTVAEPGTYTMHAPCTFVIQLKFSTVELLRENTVVTVIVSPAAGVASLMVRVT